MVRNTMSSPSASTTIVSPAWNSFHRIFSDERVLDEPLDRTAQRPGTQRSVVALLGEQELARA